MAKRLFILDGPDGAGKTTAALKVKARLVSAGHKAYYLQEPGATPFGRDLRTITMSYSQARSTHEIRSNPTAVHPEALANVYRASTIQLYEVAVIPVLEEGGVIIMDRSFFISSPIYQGFTLNKLVSSRAESIFNEAFIGIITANVDVLEYRRPEESRGRLEQLNEAYLSLATLRGYPVYDTTSIDIVDTLYADVVAHLDAAN